MSHLRVSFQTMHCHYAVITAAPCIAFSVAITQS